MVLIEPGISVARPAELAEVRCDGRELELISKVTGKQIRGSVEIPMRAKFVSQTPQSLLVCKGAQAQKVNATRMLCLSRLAREKKGE